MRSDAFIRDVLGKCDALKASAFWPPEPKIRPHAWLNNFPEEDQSVAAALLDRFTFYNEHLTDRLLSAAYDGIVDGLPKGPCAPDRNELLRALPNSVFTPVEGERPNRTDSGNLLCRKARQVLRIPQERIVDPTAALRHAKSGGSVVFLDDFIGSGDQFAYTWTRLYDNVAPRCFSELAASKSILAAYVSLVATDQGLLRIAKCAPRLVC